MPPAPNPVRLLELPGAYWQTCALHAAVKPGLLTALVRNAMRRRRIAAAVEAAERAVRTLLGTEGGQAYAYSQAETMMPAAGHRTIERLPLETANDSGLLIGIKPAPDEKGRPR